MAHDERVYVIKVRGRAGTGESTLRIPIPSSDFLVVDDARCSGCRTCQMVCTLTHERQSAPSRARLVVRHDAFVDDHPLVLVCPQCSGPECLIACPEGAIVVDGPTGARVVDPDACTGCGLCVAACHLGMIWVDEDTKTARTCDLCDGEPQCVLHCPQKVIAYRRRRR